MKKPILILGIIMVGGFFLVNTIQPISPRNLIFQIEYTKPIANVQSLQVAFYVRISSQKAEEILRDAIAMSIKSLPPSVEILGTAWDSVGLGPGDEKRIGFPNGKISIVYNPNTKTFSYL